MTATLGDHVKFLAHITKGRLDGIYESVSGVLDDMLDSVYDDDVHDQLDDVLSQLSEVADQILRVALKFGDVNRYFDGRMVTTSAEVEFGIRQEHIWYPDPAAEPRGSSTESLPLLSADDPTSPGVCYIETDPATQTITTRVVRL